MKKTIICVMGSPRRNKNTETLLEILLQEIEDLSVKVERIILSELAFKGCQGCMKCVNDGICKLQDDMQKIYPILDLADGFIIASPTYNYNITSETKAFIDRLFCYYNFINKEQWSSRFKNKKKAIIIGLCAGNKIADMGLTIEAMELPLKALEIEVFKSIDYLNTARLPVLKNMEFHETLKQLGREFAGIL